MQYCLLLVGVFHCICYLFYLLGVLSLVPMGISVFPSLYFFLSPLLFFFSFKKGISEHTYGVFLYVVLALLLLTPGITFS